MIAFIVVLAIALWAVVRAWVGLTRKPETEQGPETRTVPFREDDNQLG